MNHAETSSPIVLRALPRLIIGLAILAIGLLWTLDNLDILESEPITQWWPAVIIAVGLIRFLDPQKNKVTSGIITLVGLGILLDTLDIWDFDPGDFFPLLIAIVGAKLVFDVFRRKSLILPPGAEPDATVHAFAFMSGVGRRSSAAAFRGGDANAIMGGVELDLRGANIADGEEAVLDNFAFWGGIDVRVPENWRVVSQVMPLMGAYVDKTAGRGATAGPVLIMRGAAIMGGIEVKN